MLRFLIYIKGKAIQFPNGLSMDMRDKRKITGLWFRPETWMSGIKITKMEKLVRQSKFGLQ